MTVPALPPMAELTGYRLIKVGEQLLDVAEDALGPLALKPRHLNVLVTVQAYPEMSQQELSEVIGIDVNAMVTVMDFLERHGLAVRDRNPRDRRRHMVSLTRKGEQAVRHAGEVVARREAEYLAPLTAEEVRTLRELTGRLLGIQEERDGRQSAPEAGPESS